MAPVLDLQNTISPRFCQALVLSRACPPGVGRLGLPDREVLVRREGK